MAKTTWVMDENGETIEVAEFRSKDKDGISTFYPTPPPPSGWARGKLEKEKREQQDRKRAQNYKDWRKHRRMDEDEHEAQIAINEKESTYSTSIDMDFLAALGISAILGFVVGFAFYHLLYGFAQDMGEGWAFYFICSVIFALVFPRKILDA